MLSATSIVSSASARINPYHDRMPVLRGRDQSDARLSGDAAQDILMPAPERALRAWIVSSRASRPGVGDNGPTLIDPVTEAA